MTPVFIVTATIIIVGYDIFAAWRKSDDHETISVVLRRAAMNRPVIPFAFGYLMGHLFWCP